MSTTTLHAPSPRPSPGVPGHGAILRLLVAIALCLAPAAHAQTTRPTLSASLGFSGVFKPDGWAPIYVRVSDADAPRSGTLEVRTARGKLGHDVVARVATSRHPSTYTLYAPLGALDRASVQLRDASGKVLATLDLTDAVQQTPAALGGPAFGVAGVEADAQRVVNQLVNDTGEYVAAGALAPRLLPERAVGYTSIDCLVLAAIDADAVDDDVQAAIVSWVRSGGILVIWPGAQAPTLASSLIDALPATIGAPETLSFQGREVVGRQLTAREGASPLREGPLELPGVFQRRLGLGQIVMLASDPSRLSKTSPAERLDLWRRLTSRQLSMSPDDRREGVFDPLVAQAVGEQQLGVPDVASMHWARQVVPIGLLLGLLLGPGEMLLLAAAGRPPRTWYTVAGLALLVGCGLALVLSPTVPEAESKARIDVRVEAPDGLAASVGLAAQPAGEFAATWLTADRTDPSLQPASELQLAQREATFDVDGRMAIGSKRAKVRSVRFAGATLHPTRINADVATSRVSNASQSAWEAVAIVRRDEVRISSDTVAAGSAVSLADAAIVRADNPSTRRVETGIERLAADRAWAAILMDRRIAERLVSLLETEDVTIIAARDAGGAAITLQVIR